ARRTKRFRLIRGAIVDGYRIPSVEQPSCHARSHEAQPNKSYPRSLHAYHDVPPLHNDGPRTMRVARAAAPHRVHTRFLRTRPTCPANPRGRQVERAPGLPGFDRCRTVELTPPTR